MWPTGQEHSWALPVLPAALNKHHAHCTGISLSATVGSTILFSKDNSSVKSHFPWLAPFSIMSEKMQFDWKGMPENKTHTAAAPLSKALNPVLFQKHQVIILFSHTCTHANMRMADVKDGAIAPQLCNIHLWQVCRVLSTSTFSTFYINTGVRF